MSDNKVLKGSFVLLIGNIIFRIGGYINRLLMSRMLGPEGYGLYGLTLPFQGIFQILSAGGLPPAIAKYVAEYNVIDEKQMARQVVITSTKFMVLMGILFGIILLFSSDFIANNIFHKPLVVWPLRAISLVTPFSVVVGAMRGAFQAVYKNQYTVYNRIAEQIGTIVFAVIFVYVGLYAMGAVLGSAIGFIISAVTAVFLYKKYILPIFDVDCNNFLTIKEELHLLNKLIRFAVPVAITALSEMAIYDISTLIIGIFMLSTDVGYYNAADPIARIPLVISLSISTVLLPAAAEAYALKNMDLLKEYVIDCLRYGIIIVLPLCIGISIFSKSVLMILFGSKYIPSATVLSILVIGMAFYTIYMICSSILQGTGQPRLPMYILILGTVLNLIFNVFFVNLWGIDGAAFATTVTTFILMIVVLFVVKHNTKISIPWKNISLIILSNIFVAIVCLMLPNTIIGLLCGILVGSLIYGVSLIFLKVLTRKDLSFFSNYANKTIITQKLFNKIVNFIEKHDLIYK